MPRRTIPHPLGVAVGSRIRALRAEQGLTMEQLALQSDLTSKGHLSNIERGLALPTIGTLQVLADTLGIKLVDIVTFPEDDDRQYIIDAMRLMSRRQLVHLRKQVTQELAAKRPTSAPRKRKTSR